MGCFIVPATEAVVVSTVAKIMEKREKKFEGEQKLGESYDKAGQFKLPMSEKVKWLRNLLAGGSTLLAFEHIWHGEVIAEFPFLTAAKNHSDFVQMLHEMGTTGVGMAATVTLVWVAMLVVAKNMEKSQAKDAIKMNFAHREDNI